MSKVIIVGNRTAKIIKKVGKINEVFDSWFRALWSCISS